MIALSFCEQLADIILGCRIRCHKAADMAAFVCYHQALKDGAAAKFGEFFVAKRDE